MTTVKRASHETIYRTLFPVRARGELKRELCAYQALARAPAAVVLLAPGSRGGSARWRDLDP